MAENAEMVAPPRKRPLKSASATGSESSAPGHVRIIGGRWRGSKIPVLPSPGLRPSSDRVRETLFNWLQHEMAGSVCLDLFAGTGALGIEAGSRGAASVILIERDLRLAAQLRATAQRLDAALVHVVQSDALQWLASVMPDQFDIAFIDPPFADGLHAPLWTGLARVMRARSWIYVESSCTAPALPPQEWLLHRRGQTREVDYALYRRAPVDGQLPIPEA